MKNHSLEQTAAVSTKYFDAMLAISTIYFKGMGELSELALTTARETVGECLAASKVSVAAASGQDIAALQATLGQPMLAKIVANSTECYQIVSRSQQAAASVLATQFPAPFLQMLMPTDINGAMEIFSRGFDRFSTVGAANLAATTDAVSSIGDKIAVQSKQAA